MLFGDEFDGEALGEVENFVFYEGMDGQALADQYSQLNDTGKEKFILALVEHYSGDLAQNFPGFPINGQVVQLETFVAIAKTLKDPNIDTQNHQRAILQIKQKIPDRAIYPEEDTKIVYTRENSYMLETDDVLVGFDYLHQQMKAIPQDPKQSLRYMLMTTLYSWSFDEATGQVIDESDYRIMSESLSCLVLDAVKNKTPVVIGGILNVNHNHYINYFCVWNPEKDELKVFILDPLYEVHKDIKTPKETKYANIIINMLIQHKSKHPELWGKITFKAIVRSLCITQQLNGITCGYFCLQNLLDVLVTRNVLLCTPDDILFNAAALTYNGNRGRYYDNKRGVYVYSEKVFRFFDFVKNMYCYSPEVKAFDAAVRSFWSTCFGGENPNSARTFMMYPLKEQPTLDDALEEPVPNEDYHYLSRITACFNELISRLIRHKVSSLFSELCDVNGAKIISICKEQYEVQGFLPTEEDFIEYSVLYKQKHPFIHVNGKKYNHNEVEQLLGKPLVAVIKGIMLERLKQSHNHVFEGRFVQYLFDYQWPENAYDWRCIVDDFFAMPDWQDAISAMGASVSAGVRKHCEQLYAEQIKTCFVQNRMEKVRSDLVDNIFELLERLEFQDADNSKTFLKDLIDVLIVYYSEVMGFNRIEEFDNFCRLANIQSLHDTVYACLKKLYEEQIFNLYWPRLKAKIENEENLEVLKALSGIQTQEPADLQKRHEQWSDFCCLDEATKSVQYGRFLRNLLLDHIREELQKRVLPQLPDTQSVFDTIRAQVFSEDIPLGTRLRTPPSTWRAVVDSDPRWNDLIPLCPDLIENKLQALDQKCEDIKRKLLKDSCRQFVAKAAIVRLESLVTPNPRMIAGLWNVFSKEIVRFESTRSITQKEIREYAHNLAKEISDALVHPQKLFSLLQADVDALIELVNSLVNSLENEHPQIKEYLKFLNKKREAIQEARKNYTLEAFENFAAQCRTELVKEFDGFLRNMAKSYNVGDKDPHHITYCLRPFLGRIFNVSLLSRGKISTRLVYELEDLTTVDEAMAGCFVGSRLALPKIGSSNIPFLVQPRKVDYQNAKVCDAGLLISMIHAIDTDHYKANSYPFWLSCLKPLRTALANVLDQLADSSTIDTVIPQNLLTELASTFDQAAQKVKALKKDDQAVRDLKQLIEVLRKFSVKNEALKQLAPGGESVLPASTLQSEEGQNDAFSKLF